jgi:hypothetical protein
MAEPEKTASEKLVSNVALTLWARGAMIVTTSLILPIALMIGSRAVSNIDKLDESSTRLRSRRRSSRAN